MKLPWRKPPEQPERPKNIVVPDDTDIIPARNLVPEAFADLEVDDYEDPSQLLGDMELINACTNLLGRTGCDEYATRVSKDEHPIVFIFMARWGDHWEAMAGTKLSQAVFRMAQHIVDGGLCVHCQKPTGVDRDFADELDTEHICWYQMDPELKRFRRSCEGDHEEED